MNQQQGGKRCGFCCSAIGGERFCPKCGYDTMLQESPYDKRYASAQYSCYGGYAPGRAVGVGGGMPKPAEKRLSPIQLALIGAGVLVVLVALLIGLRPKNDGARPPVSSSSTNSSSTDTSSTDTSSTDTTGTEATTTAATTTTATQQSNVTLEANDPDNGDEDNDASEVGKKSIDIKKTRVIVGNDGDPSTYKVTITIDISDPKYKDMDDLWCWVVYFNEICDLWEFPDVFSIDKDKISDGVYEFEVEIPESRSIRVELYNCTVPDTGSEPEDKPLMESEIFWVGE